jgi:hypothetical protein
MVNIAKVNRFLLLVSGISREDNDDEGCREIAG